MPGFCGGDTWRVLGASSLGTSGRSVMNRSIWLAVKALRKAVLSSLSPVNIQIRFLARSMAAFTTDATWAEL